MLDFVGVENYSYILYIQLGKYHCSHDHIVPRPAAAAVAAAVRGQVAGTSENPKKLTKKLEKIKSWDIEYVLTKNINL